MDKAEARELLAIHRPGIPEDVDERMAEALKLAQHDPELARWHNIHCRFHLAMQAKLSQIPVPEDLKSIILSGKAARRRRIIDLRPFLLPLAAAAVFLLLGVMVWSFRVRPHGDLFGDSRERIVREAQRGYALSLKSTNLTQIHSFLVATNFPDYNLTKPLADLPALGCAMVDFRGHKVSMVCLAKGKEQIWLFVMNRAELLQTPDPGKTEFMPIYRVMTASWTQGDRVYILAGPGQEADLKPYLD